MAGLRTSSSPIWPEKRSAPPNVKPLAQAIRSPQLPLPQRLSQVADALDTVQNGMDAIMLTLRNPLPPLNELAITDETGKPIAYIGAKVVNGVVYRGILTEALRVGPDVENPIILADENGVAIDGATLVLGSNSITTELNNSTDTDAISAVGLKVSETAEPARKTMIVRDGIEAWGKNGSGTSGGLFYLRGQGSPPYYGVLTLSNITNGWNAGIEPGGSSPSIWANGTGAHLTLDGYTVVKTRQSAVGDANTAHACASYADVNTALNALGTKINTILDRIGTPGHGLTAD